MKKIVDIIILAGGKGTRMGEFTKHTPKPLLMIDDKPLLEYLLDYLIKERIFNITVTYSYLESCWKNIIEKYSNDVTFVYVKDCKNLVETIYYSYDCAKLKANDILIMSADIVFDYSIIRDLIEKHIKKDNQCTVALNEKCGRWKKWNYIINKGRIVDILIDKDYQLVERYFFIIKRNILLDLKKKSLIILNNESNQSDYLLNYGTGLCFLLKLYIINNVLITSSIYDSNMVNLNDIQDFTKAKEILILNNK